MYLLVANAALACSDREWVEFLATTDLPVDGRALLDASWPLEDVRVVAPDGADVPVEVESFWAVESYALDHTLYAVRPASGAWEVGFTLVAEGNDEHETVVTVDPAGRRAVPVEGLPEIPYLGALHRHVTGDSCTHYDAVEYATTLVPAAADPDGMSLLLLVRSDGSTRVMRAPSDGEGFDLDLWMPGADDDCFTLTQVDGAGNRSTGEEVCAPPWEYIPDPSPALCAATGPRTSLLLMGIAALVSRRRTGR